MATILPTGQNLDNVKSEGTYLVRDPEDMEDGHYWVLVIEGADVSGNNFMVQRALNIRTAVEYSRAEEAEGFTEWVGSEGGGGEDFVNTSIEADTITDLDELVTHGDYAVYMHNGPGAAEQYYYLHVTAAPENAVLQVLTVVSGEDAPQSWARYMADGWSPLKAVSANAFEFDTSDLNQSEGNFYVFADPSPGDTISLSYDGDQFGAWTFVAADPQEGEILITPGQGNTQAGLIYDAISAVVTEEGEDSIFIVTWDGGNNVVVINTRGDDDAVITSSNEDSVYPNAFDAGVVPPEARDLNGMLAEIWSDMADAAEDFEQLYTLVDSQSGVTYENVTTNGDTPAVVGPGSNERRYLVTSGGSQGGEEFVVSDGQWPGQRATIEFIVRTHADDRIHVTPGNFRAGTPLDSTSWASTYLFPYVLEDEGDSIGLMWGMDAWYVTAASPLPTTFEATVEFTITPWDFTGTIGFGNDTVDTLVGGTIDPFPAKVAGLYDVIRMIDLTGDDTFTIVLDYEVGANPGAEALFASVHIVGVDDAVDVTLLSSGTSGFNYAYNGDYTAWIWAGALGLVPGNDYTVTFTLA